MKELPKNFKERLNNGKENFYQTARFMISGGFNTVIDFSVLNVLLFVFGFQSVILYSVFKGVSFLTAVINSYFLNKYWVFALRSKISAKEMGIFFSINILGLSINLFVATLTVILLKSSGSVFASGLPLANSGAVAGTFVVATLNFFVYKFIVFKK